jgi:hypothetical protein
VATLTGRTARSILLPCDTPGAATAGPRDPDGLSRSAAEAAWHAVTPLIAGTAHVRISRDGGRTYPVRHARPLPADPPGQPCTVPVYDPGAAGGRMLALDLDPARGRGAADPAAQVSTQADAIARLVARLGGRCVTDVAPGGGRHVLVLFAAALPWQELRDLARAMARRYPAVNPAPMSSLGGQISPPGARHKSGGWRVLAGPVEGARAAVERPNGPGLWNALLAEFAAELRQGSAAADAGAAELDDAGVPWVPRLGGRVPLGPELDHIARTGRWDRSRYPGRSEARMAVLAAAAPAAGSSPTSWPPSAPGPGAAWPGCTSGARSPGGWTGCCRMSGEKPSASPAGRKTCAAGTQATPTHAPRQDRTAALMRTA